MNKIILSLAFIVVCSLTMAQTNQKIQMGFYKVDEDMRAEYETVMKDYLGKMMAERVKQGCMSNWIFRRVVPNSSMAENFTHMTIDVMNPGDENYWNCDTFDVDLVFPNISPELHSILQEVHRKSRNVIYRTKLDGVAGHNKLDHVGHIAIYNFTKTKSQKYKQKHIKMGAVFTDYGNRDAWYAFERDEPIDWATKEWDYMTVDVYDSVEKMKSQGKQMPEKIRNEMNKKYGNGNSQREIMKRVMTTLIYAVK